MWHSCIVLARCSLALLRRRSYSVQKNVSEILCRTLVRDVQQATFRVPKIVVERVVHHHADEATHDDRRIHFDQRSLALSLANVCAEKLINASNKLVEEHLRELVFLECRVKQQTLKLRIVLVVIQSAECERLKNGAIVFALDGRRQPSRPVQTSRPSTLCDRESRRKALLSWRSAGRPWLPKRLPPGRFLSLSFRGNLSRKRDLRPLGGSEAGALLRPYGRCSRAPSTVICLLNLSSSTPALLRRKVSTYLPPGDYRCQECVSKGASVVVQSDP